MFTLLSFIGVSNSLPTTAYIKLIDVWMIMTMMYPFSVVALYSVIQFIRDQDNSSNDTIDGMNWRSRIIFRSANVMLDYGLPLLVSFFIVLFWSLGLVLHSQ